jgi:hypothetical protein
MASSRIKVLRTTIIAWLAGMSASCVMSQKLTRDYDFIDTCSEGLARVEINGKWGFIDQTGKEVIPCKYDEADFFNKGVAKVNLNGKIYFIDKEGNKVICK